MTTGSGESETVSERSFCSATLNGLLKPEWALPSSARTTRFVAGRSAVMFPVQTPLVKGPVTVGVIDEGVDEPGLKRRSTNHQRAPSVFAGKTSPTPS